MRKLFYYVVILLLVQACKKTEDDATYSVDTMSESAQQVGDVSASVDESGGTSNGSFASITLEAEAAKKAFARLSGEELHTAKVSSLFLPEAQAAACKDVTFGACTSGQKVRDFASCTVGTAGVMTGNVTLAFNDPCKIDSDGDTVTRIPNFNISGLRGATFSVSAPTTGQTMARTGLGQFLFSNNGIRRTFVTPKGITLLDVTTTTGTALSVTGANRSGRVINSGTLIVTNNLTNEACTLSPTTVTWAAGCNCPTSGFWQGTCAPSGNTFKVTYNSTCGEVSVEKTGETTQTVSLDRCSI